MSFMPLWAFRALLVRVQNNSPGKKNKKTKKAFCLRLMKQEKPVLSSNTSGLSGALVSRGDRDTSGLCAVLSVDEMRSTGPREKPALFIKHQGRRLRLWCLCSDRWQRQLLRWQHYGQQVSKWFWTAFFFFFPIKMAEKFWLCEAFHWVKCGRGSESRKELLTVRPVWLF